MLAILLPPAPIQAPIGSTRSSLENTATLLRIPASLTTAYSSIVPSTSSGISVSNNLLTKP